MSEDELALFSEIQKEFNSKDQKARRAKWETENQSRPSQKEIDRQLKDPRSKIEKELDRKLGIKDNPRYNKTEKEAIDAAKKHKFRSDLRYRNITVDKLKTDPTIRQRFRERKAQILKGKKSTEELFNKLERERVENEAKAKIEAEIKAQKARKAVVEESIAKHKAKAAELRAKKAAGKKLVKNLKTAGKVGLGAAAGTAALVGGGAYLYNKSKKKDQDKDNNQ